MEPIFKVGDPVETLCDPKGLGKVTHARVDYTVAMNNHEWQPMIGVRLVGRKADLAFCADELRLCKCKDRLPLGASQCTT